MTNKVLAISLRRCLLTLLYSEGQAKGEKKKQQEKWKKYILRDNNFNVCAVCINPVTAQ